MWLLAIGESLFFHIDTGSIIVASTILYGTWKIGRPLAVILEQHKILWEWHIDKNEPHYSDMPEKQLLARKKGVE